ncbi:MAG: TonB-dependent receptor [Odoribacteraceae bacterium]|jgi:TonB-linked SusC/RagA family outer membrane protein|nr:TonB-dependent receptor [Odoribacteraceae bacterium]
MMKLCGFFLFGFIVCVSANVKAQEEKVSLDLKEVSLGTLFNEIQKQTRLSFVFNVEQTRDLGRFSVKAEEETVTSVLKRVFANTGVTFDHEGSLIVVRPAPLQQARREGKVQGKVTDQGGLPLPGVSVVIDGTGTGIVTDEHGAYTLSYPEGQKITLRFSFVGMKTVYVETGGRSTVNVTMEEEIGHLDEIVLTGYGTTKAKDMTGAVARLGSKVLETVPMGATIQSMLQGRTPGVNVMISSASPTSPVSVIIRGASSLSGDSQPLWVIDGVPEYNAGTSGNVSNTLYNLNLTDVESIDILKDASATAIYGSRAANGVVLVTTKRGKAGITPTMEFASRYGVQVLEANNFGVLNAQEYINFSKAAVGASFFTRGTLDYFTRKYINEAYFNARTNHSQFDLQTLTEEFFLENAYYDGDTDWWKLMTRDAATREHSLSIRGGSKEASYNVSFFYKDQQGIVKGGNSVLLGGTMNFDASIREVLRFKLGVKASSRVTNNKDNLITNILDMRPDLPAYTEDGNINMIDSYTQNPLFFLKNTDEGKNKDITASLGLEWDLLKGLTLRTTGTLKYAISKSNSYQRKYYADGQNSASISKNENYTYVWDNTLTYTKQLGNHHVVGLGGVSLEKYETDGLSASGSNFPDDDVLVNLGSAATKNTIGSSYTSNALVSSFARVEYKWNNRYLATATFRADGSSKFGRDKRWGYFPSAALAWIITEEDFMKPLAPALSYLKLRGSIGKTGSQNLGNYDWRTLMGSAIYNGEPGIRPSSVGNDLLQWESQLQKEIGADFGFWGDRVRGSIGYYQKDVDNLLYNDPIPISSSFSNVTQNIGSIRNRGIEFEARVEIIKNPKKNLTWDVDFNISRNITTLEKLNSIATFFGGGTYDTFKIEEGGKTGVFYGYKYAGRLVMTNEELVALKSYDPETGNQNYYRDSYNYERPGDLYILDLNGDGKVDVTNDRTAIGNANPDFFGGFGSTLYWKGLMVNATFVYSVGADRLWDEEKNSAGDINVFNASKEILKTWTLMPGVDRGYPRAMYYGWGTNSIITDRYIHDASFLRLSALNINYRLPRPFGASLVHAIDLTFQATNLFTWTKYPGMDPQGNFSTTYSAFYNMGVDYSYYPSARTYNIGLKITLK